MADLMLPRGKEKILKAEDKDYDRGLLVKLLDNGGYSMKYWYETTDKAAPVEILVDGKSIKKDAKVVEMKFHPKSYYKESKMNLKTLVKETIKEVVTEKKLKGGSEMDVNNVYCLLIKNDSILYKVKAIKDIQDELKTSVWKRRITIYKRK